MSALIEQGRAKVNLSLRVVGRRADGYHDLESVVAFADCADRLTLEPGGEQPGDEHGGGQHAAGDGDVAPPALVQFLEMLTRDRNYSEGLPRKALIDAFRVIDDADLVGTYRRKMSSVLF